MEAKEDYAFLCPNCFTDHDLYEENINTLNRKDRENPWVCHNCGWEGKKVELLKVDKQLRILEKLVEKSVTGLDRDIENLSKVLDLLNTYILKKSESYRNNLDCIKDFRNRLSKLINKTDDIINTARITGEKN